MLLTDGNSADSGSLIRIVWTFGAVAPAIMLSSKPTPETLRATRGSVSLLPDSLRISVLMTRSIGPRGPGRSSGPLGRVRVIVASAGPVTSPGSSGPTPLSDPAASSGPACAGWPTELTGTRVTCA